MSAKNIRLKYLTVVVAGSVVIFLITFFLYVPALENDFVNWDDNIYIYENANIRSLDVESLQWMFTTFRATNWHPLTWLSHAIVYHFWGLNPRMHHLINLIIHSFNTVLVFVLVIQLMSLWMTGVCPISSTPRMFPPIPQALLVGGITALLLGLHPVHVESVVWVTERKDLLSAFFYILSIISYLSYTSSAVSKRSMWFILSILLFSLALMAKPMAVSLPIVLLLIDYYPLKRLDKPNHKFIILVKEKIPFFLLSMVSAILTIIAQKSGGALGSLDQFPLGSRLLNALRSLLFYLGKIIYPLELSPFYPFPTQDHFLNLQYFLSAILVALVTLGCLWMIKRKRCLFPTIWFYFVVTLLPVIGIVQVGMQAAADRYLYLPSLSIYMLFAIGVFWLWERFSSRRFKGLTQGMLVACICIIMLLLSRLTVQQIGVWKNSEVLWKYVIDLFPNSYAVAYYNLGETYVDQGRLDEAFQEYRKAIAMWPLYYQARTQLGAAYAKKGMTDEAISEYRQSIAIEPTYAKAHCNLGAEYIRKKMFDEAIASCNKAIDLRPNYSKAYFNLGAAYGNKGMVDEAIVNFRKAITIKPNYAKAQYNLGLAYYSKEQFSLAIVHLDKARELGYSIKPELLELLKSFR